ncbi:MAG: diaminopimelate epimerase, partial [Tissierella sp.]
MKFTKMNGAGNDFIIINNIIEKIPKGKFSYLASKLCARRLSIGADGIMFVDNHKNNGDYRMHFFNSDGSEGEMCGNG